MVELELIRFPSVVYRYSIQYIGRQSCCADKDPELFRFDPYLKNCFKLLRLRIRIQGFDDQKLRKYTAEIFIYISFLDPYPDPVPHQKWCESARSGLQTLFVSVHGPPWLHFSL